MSAKIPESSCTADHLISVILPVYNCETWVERAIRSIFAQSHRKIELIFVDDVSSDHTVGVIESLKGECPDGMSITIVRNDENGGSAKCRQQGLDAARGKYVYFMDGDDWLLEHSLETLLSLAETHQVPLVCGAFKYSKEVCDDMRPETPTVELFHSRMESLTAYRDGQPATTPDGKYITFTWNKLLLREFVEEVQLDFDSRFGNSEDQLWSFKLFTRIDHWARTDEVTYIYEVGNDFSITRRQPGDKRLRNLYMILDYMREVSDESWVHEGGYLDVLSEIILNFTKSMLWNIEAADDVCAREHYSIFRKKNAFGKGSTLYLCLPGRYRKYAAGWGLPYPYIRLFSPYYLSRIKERVFRIRCRPDKVA